MSGALANVREKASLGFNKAKSAVGLAPPPEPESTGPTLDEMASFCPKLTYKQRIYGFAICFGIGYLITIMSFNFFDMLRDDGNAVPFVVIYTLGNVISLLASMFLCGFQTQFKRMFDDTRRITTIVYLSTLLASIIICFIPFNADWKLLILVLLLIAQFLSSTWYTLSYIPFGRRAVKKCFKKEFGDEA